jgi:predicted nucleic acid-binding Zn ribbon protein
MSDFVPMFSLGYYPERKVIFCFMHIPAGQLYCSEDCKIKDVAREI